MPRVPHIQPNESTGDRPPAGRADVSAAAWCAVGWKASANHNRLFHSALNTPPPGRACPAPAGGGLGRVFFGETAVSQKLSWWSTPYQFTGKEKDDETGYNYFGARYYNSDISIWLSVDPLADKYPSLSPYMYCAGNPVMLVDPDGREIDVTELYKKNKEGEYMYKEQIAAFEAFISSKEGQQELSKYAKKGQTIAGVTFDKDGEYHLSKIDIAFVGSKGLSTGDNRDGQTSAEIKNGRLMISICVAGQSNTASGLITTIHEVFIHGSQYSRDYKDNKKLDNSHAYPGLREYDKKHGKNTGYIHHVQELNSDKHMDKYGLPIMRDYYKKIGIKKTDEQIRKLMRFQL